jgi:hypothetical protein
MIAMEELASRPLRDFLRALCGYKLMTAKSAKQIAKLARKIHYAISFSTAEHRSHTVGNFWSSPTRAE